MNTDTEQLTTEFVGIAEKLQQDLQEQFGFSVNVTATFQEQGLALLLWKVMPGNEEHVVEVSIPDTMLKNYFNAVESR